MLPCPTFYPPFPTNPPAPPAPAVVEEVKAASTTTTTTTSTTVTTTVNTEPCVLGEVKRTDGSCQKITAEVIEEMKALVKEKKRLLDIAEADYNNPVKHRKSVDIMGDSGALLYAHEEYRKALDLLLAMMALYTPPTPAPGPAAVAADLGPEFVEGKWDGKAHCEAWTVRTTCGATPNECGVICRHQPFCKGFALNAAENDMCVWFDYSPPDPADTPHCAGPPEALHSFWTKARNVTTDGKILGAMEKIRITSDLLEGVLHKSDTDAQLANQSLIVWEAETNQTLKDSLEAFFLEAKNNYTSAIADAKVVREERQASVDDALKQIEADTIAIEDGGTGVGDPLPPTTTTTTTTTVATTTTTLPPVVELHWKDFPNSEDSLWAEKHPECPMGPPCFCDCKCRGAPPQNFVEPPPPLPAPCPGPPPLPPPSAFSMPLGAPALPLGPSVR